MKDTTFGILVGAAVLAVVVGLCTMKYSPSTRLRELKEELFQHQATLRCYTEALENFPRAAISGQDYVKLVGWKTCAQLQVIETEAKIKELEAKNQPEQPK